MKSPAVAPEGAGTHEKESKTGAERRGMPLELINLNLLMS
jgi:hypothetical protein